MADSKESPHSWCWRGAWVGRGLTDGAMNAKGVNAMGDPVVHYAKTLHRGQASRLKVACFDDDPFITEPLHSWRLFQLGELHDDEAENVTCPDCLKAIIEQCEARLKELETKE